MSQNPVQCPHCRAPIRSPSGGLCEYCGNALWPDGPRPVEHASAPAAARSKRSLAGIEAHERFGELMTFVPRESRAVHRGMLPGIAFLLVFLSITVYRMTLAMQERASLLRADVVMPAGFAALSFALLLRALRRRSALRAAPLERWVARVERLRSERRDDAGSARSVRAEFANDSGRKQAVFLPRALRDRVGEGDLGVVYTKGGRFVDFQSFDQQSAR